MEGLLKSIMPPSYKNDKIQEMAEYLESLGVSSMKDMRKTDETALKKSNHFNVISVGKIKDYLRKDYPEVLQIFISNDLKNLENERDEAIQKQEVIKTANFKIEHLDECKEAEIKMLNDEEKEFKERLRKLEELKHEVPFNKKNSKEWKKLIDDIDQNIDYAKKQLKLNKVLRIEREEHYFKTKKNLHINF